MLIKPVSLRLSHCEIQLLVKVELIVARYSRHEVLAQTPRSRDSAQYNAARIECKPIVSI
jgi:hypothetical protein